LSYRAQMKGWRFLYLPEVECPSELPVEMNAFKAQQARWAKGLMQSAKKILPRLLRSKQSPRVKAEAVFHLTANISYPLMVVLSTMLLPAMIVRFYQGMFQVLVIDLPLFLASTMSISTFYLTSQRELDRKRWKRTILYLPFLMAIGIGLCVQNARAVLGAIFGVRSEFVRTPKYRIETAQDTWAGKIYRNRAGLLPLVEIAIGLYFVFTVYYAFDNENYATIPFLLLFVWGYLYTGFLSLAQIYWERFRLARPASRYAERASATGAASF
jgi:cellulose synthase/poly-beta-1,6-N-acetylglucosamine synthase-like glycosyltransferase